MFAVCNRLIINDRKDNVTDILIGSYLLHVLSIYMIYSTSNI